MSLAAGLLEVIGLFRDNLQPVAAPDAGFGRLFILTVAIIAVPAVQVVQVLRGATHTCCSPPGAVASG